jgi:cyclophilin family peptidyl-prolyl cis-trans isomerase
MKSILKAVWFSLFILLAIQVVPAFATTVRMQTPMGAIDIELYDTAAPKTVTNFLNYVNSGAYLNSFIHRLEPNFVIQGGGFRWNAATSQAEAVPTNAAIVNEFSATRSNLRGTIAMARFGGQPNSATSQWFINLANNQFLDSVDGGFTVFGKVTDASMAVVDAISLQRIINAGDVFNTLPYLGTIGTQITLANLITTNPISIGSGTTPGTALNYSGLWWNAAESGWGMSITQKRNIIFAAMYTYDAAGLPTWYVMSRCEMPATSNTTCTGPIYKVSGGTAPTVAWLGTNKLTDVAGSGTLTFESAKSAKFSFTLNGVTSSKDITPQPIATGSAPPSFDFTDLWWNPAEDGWGMAISQQFDVAFATWYAYDATGKAIWYVADQCKLLGTRCEGKLYQVSGGVPLTVAWSGSNRKVVEVGTLSLVFTDVNNGDMSYTLNGTKYLRKITRQLF